MKEKKEWKILTLYLESVLHEEESTGAILEKRGSWVRRNAWEMPSRASRNASVEEKETCENLGAKVGQEADPQSTHTWAFQRSCPRVKQAAE